MITPITMIAINWQWQPSALNLWSKSLFWLTETGSTPWAIFTCVFFAGIFAICMKPKSKMQLIKLVAVLVIAMLAGQIIKSGIKTYTAESRPFVLWIEDTYQVEDDYFYSLPRSERRDLVKEHVAGSTQIPKWLYQHWRNETGYSFPSGHTMFATTWAFLALVLFNFKRKQMVVGLIIGWAVLMEISRVALGMHHASDLIVGSIIAWLVAIFCYYLAKRWRVVDE